MAEGTINIVQAYNGYKVYGNRFHTRARNANSKTYSCGGVVVKGTTAIDAGGVDLYGVLEEVEDLSKPIKHCVLFHCDWFTPSNC